MYYPHIQGTELIDVTQKMAWTDIIQFDNYQQLGAAKAWHISNPLPDEYLIYAANGYSLYGLGRYTYILRYENYETYVVYDYLVSEVAKSCFGFTSKHTLATIITYQHGLRGYDMHVTESMLDCAMPTGYEYMRDYFVYLFKTVDFRGVTPLENTPSWGSLWYEVNGHSWYANHRDYKLVLVK